jgi:hypothetical protein
LGGFSEKGKPVEKQGRKVSDLRGKTYDSGAAGFVLVALMFINKGGSCYLSSQFQQLIPLCAIRWADCLPAHILLQLLQKLMSFEQGMKLFMQQRTS